MGKITITHYLNKRLRSSLGRNGIEYPVYIRVSYGRKNERIKSDWFVHPCSERDFETDKHIIQLREYEAEIVRDIIESAKTDTFNLSARLGHSKYDIPEIFQDGMFDKDEIKRQVITYLSKKSGLSESILNPYFREELFYDGWAELCNKDIFDDCTKAKVTYLSMLLEYEERNYPPLPDSVFGYRAGCVFVFHEWKNKNGESKFLKFARKKNLISVDRLNDITRKFNDMLLEYNEFDLRIEARDKSVK